jgi:peptide chain release factor 1
MRDQLEAKLARFEELERALADPAVLADQQRMAAVAREHGSLARLAGRYRDLLAVERQLAELEDLRRSEDEELRSLAEAELPELEARREAEWDALAELCGGDDDAERRRCIVELRAGTGGEEAALFVRDL